MEARIEFNGESSVYFDWSGRRRTVKISWPSHARMQHQCRDEKEMS